MEAPAGTALPGRRHRRLLLALALLLLPSAAGVPTAATAAHAESATGGRASPARPALPPKVKHVGQTLAEVAKQIGASGADGGDTAFTVLLGLYDGDGDGKLSAAELAELKATLGQWDTGKPPAGGHGTPLPDLVRTQGVTDLAAWRKDSHGRRADVSKAQFLERFSTLLDDAEATFDALDTDSNGSLRAEEFVLMHNHVPSQLSYDEFSKWYHMRLARSSDAGQSLFNALDNDGDSLLSTEEVRAMHDKPVQPRPPPLTPPKPAENEAPVIAAQNLGMDLSTFHNKFAQKLLGVPLAEIPRLYGKLDSDSNRRVTPAELRKLGAFLPESTDKSTFDLWFAAPERNGIEVTAEALWAAVDTDSSGELRAGEIVAFANAAPARAGTGFAAPLGHQQKEMEAAVARPVHPLDKKGGGSGPVNLVLGLTEEQFAKRMGKGAESVRGLFKLLDTDGTGRLTPNEMRGVAAFGQEL